MTTSSSHIYETIDRFSVWAHLDNEDPGHTYFHGHIRTFLSTLDITMIYALEANPAFMELVDRDNLPIFLLDDGESVIPLYVSGQPSSPTELWLSKFPTEAYKNQPDHGYNDIDTWSLGPRTAYHLKARF